jgi:hypothetical protein
MPTRSRAPAEAIENFGKKKARSGFPLGPIVAMMHF